MNEAANTKAIGSGKTSSAWGDPVRLVRYLARLMADSRVPKTAKLKVAAAGLYLWVDGDLVPDPIRLIPGLGYVDDLILVVHGLKCLVAETEPRVAAELWPGDEASFKRTLKALAWLDDQLYGRLRRGLRWVLDRVTGGATAAEATEPAGK
jgi:uncharacterized membrane protein YkvA (DUF1232 family)